MFRVVYYLAFVVKNKKKMILAFPNLRLRLNPHLKNVIRDVRSIIYTNPDHTTLGAPSTSIEK